MFLLRYPAGFVAFVCLAAVTLSAQQVTDAAPFTATPAALLSALPASPAADEQAAVLLDETKIELDQEGRQVTTARMIFKVYTREAADGWAMSETQYAPWHQARPQVRARVISPEGKVTQFDPATAGEVPIRDESDRVLSDKLALRAPLPAMVPGSVVEQEIVTRDTAPFFGGSVSGRTYFGATVPVQHTRVVLSYPVGLTVRHHLNSLPQARLNETEAGGRKVVTVDHGPIAAIKARPTLLPLDDPGSPGFVYSAGKDWRGLSAAYAGAVESQLKDWKGDFMPSFPANATREQKITAILTRLHGHVRYTGIEFAEAAIIPRSPAEVLQRQYGDCKDKSALLVAMLRAAGIKAHLALLLSGTTADIDPRHPALNVFNHAIVYVPGSPAYWLDATDPDLRVGVISSDNHGRWALVADSEGQNLMRIPLNTSRDNRIIETREFFLAELGRAKVVETSEVFGALDREYRANLGRLDEKHAMETIGKYATWTYGESKVAKLVRADPGDLSKPYSMRIELEDAQRGTSGREEAAVGIIWQDLTARLPSFFVTDPEEQAKSARAAEKAPGRTEDFHISEPARIEWRYRIHPAPGFKPRPAPEAITEKLGPASFTASFEVEGDVLTGVVAFDLPASRWTAAEGLELRSKVLELRKRDPLLLYFDHVGESHLSAGRVKEALVEFRALQKLHPKEALHADQMARALLAAGAGTAARVEARRGVELEPNSAVAYANLATVLKHDLVGRLLKKGFDMNGAVGAYRKAVELDPSKAELRGNLAILLEHDDHGRRYAPGARLQEAIAEYRAVSDRLEELNIGNNLGAALLRAGQFKDLVEHCKTRKPGADSMSYKLAAIAMLSGPKVAVDTASKEIGSAPVRYQALMGAGQHLLAIRSYAAAADLFEAGLPASPNRAALQGSIAVFRRTKKVDGSAGESTPEAIVKSLYAAILMPDASASLERMKRMVTKHLQASFGEDDAATLYKSLQPMRAQMSASGMTQEMAVDLFLAAAPVISEGTDESGFVVRVAIPGEATGKQHTYLIVKETGEYRMLAGFDLYEGVALAALASADLNHARRLLDFAREELEAPGSDTDPLRAHPFVALWKRGEQAGKPEVDRAAAALLAVTAQGAKAISILENAVATAPEGSVRNHVLLALASAYVSANNNEKSSQTVDRLLAAVPDSLVAFGVAADFFTRTGNKAALSKLIASAPDRLRNNDNFVRAAASALMSTGGYAESLELHQKLISRGRGHEGDYNSIAWLHLLANSVNAKSLEAIDKSVMLSQNKYPEILHTLAAIQAEQGLLAEARTSLLKRMELKGADEPDNEDWYVFGRIAEHYGLSDAAAEMYSKVQKPKQLAAMFASSYPLAQRRLQALTPSATSSR